MVSDSGGARFKLKTYVRIRIAQAIQRYDTQQQIYLLKITYKFNIPVVIKKFGQLSLLAAALRIKVFLDWSLILTLKLINYVINF